MIHYAALLSNQPILEPLPRGWMSAQVTLRHRSGDEESRYEILDLRQNSLEHATRYRHDPMIVIALKCFLLTLVLPVYFMLYSAFHVVRAPLALFYNRSFSLMTQALWAVVRAPFYFLGLECAALYGIVRPLHGMALFGRLEGQLHQKKRQESLQYKRELDGVPVGDIVLQSLLAKEDSFTYFLAFCMQPIGKTDEPHILNVVPAI